MKKYFMKGTEDEIQFGDMVVVNLSKDMSDGHTQYQHFECRFLPDLVPLLMESDVIEEKEVEEEENTKAEEKADLEMKFFVDLMHFNECIVRDHEDLELRVDKLENEIMKLKKAFFLNKMQNRKAQSGKNAKKAI